MDKYLIINADDFGMCHSANEAVFDLFKKGGITSATIMTPCSWAKEAGVTAGTGDGTVFSPDMIISREQICTMLIRYCDKVGIALPASDGSKFIDDTEIDSWAQDGVYRAKTAGIVSGRGENRFDPNALLTRQEIAVILKNFHLGFIRAN